MLDNGKKISLESIKTMSMDEIIDLYRQGYRLDYVDSVDTIGPEIRPEMNVMTYGTQCSGSPELTFNNTSVLQGTYGAVQKGRVWAQRFYGNFRCLDFVQFNMTRYANVNFYIEIRKDDGIGEGKPIGVPLVDDTGLIMRTSSIPYSDIPTGSWGWVSPTVGAILPTDAYYWICFVPTDFFDSPIYRDGPEDDRFGLQDGTNIADKRSAVFANGTWINSSTFAFAVFKKPTFTAQCTSISNVIANPSTALVGESISLSAQASPSGTYSVEFYDETTGTVLMTDTATAPKSAYGGLWTPTTAGTYLVKARVVGQCTSPGTTTVTINCSPTVSGVTANPSTVQVGQSVTLTAMVTPSGAYTVQFIKTDGIVLASDTSTTSKMTYSAVWTPTITGTYDIVAKTSAQPLSCANQPVETVTVNPAPITCTSITDVIPTPSTVTVNNPVTLSATTSPSGIFTVEFFNSDNPTQVFATDVATTSKSSYSAQWTPTTAGTYRVKARVGTQCTSSAAATVTVNPVTVTCTSITTPTAAPSTVVAGNTVTVSADVSPAGAYTVEFFNSDNPTEVFASKTETTTVTTYSQTWIPTTAGTYNIKARVGTQCTSLTTVTVTVNPSTITCVSITTPTATPSTLTEGGSTILSATVTPSEPTTQEFSVIFMDGAIQIGTPVTTVNRIATKTFYPSVGTHNISTKVGTECVSPGTVQVTVSTVPVQAGVGGALVIAAAAAIGVAYFMMRKPPSPK